MQSSMELVHRVSVVICAHDDARFEWLAAAVASVFSQHPAPHEVVVVIDHNPDLLERAHDRFQDVRVVPNADTKGLSGARNTGIRNARGDVIAFLDDDAEARPGWLAGLRAAYDGSSILGVGGSIVPRWGSKAPAWFPDEYLWVLGCSYRGLPMRRAEVRNLIGCNMSFRRSVFEAVGGFRQSVGRGRGLPLGGEETELCIRATSALPGGTLVYEPAAVVDHRVPASRGRISYFLTRCYSEGISKAYVVKFVGRGAGMRSERRYLARTLTSGMARHLLSVRSEGAAGIARAAMIPVGLIAFGAGYFWGLVRFRTEQPIATVAQVPQLED